MNKTPLLRRITGMVLLLAVALPYAGDATELRGDNASVEVKEGANGQARLSIGLTDPDSGTDGSLEISFGTGVPADQSVVRLPENPLVEKKLLLQASRTDAGIEPQAMEIEIADGRVVKISFPETAPLRPDIAFVFNLSKMKYTKAFNGKESIAALEENPGRYLTVKAEAGYWIFYGSDGYPPLIVTGFSPGRATYLLSNDGSFNTFYNSDLTTALSFLNIPQQASWSDENELANAANAFLSRHLH